MLIEFVVVGIVVVVVGVARFREWVWRKESRRGSTGKRDGSGIEQDRRGKEKPEC